MHTSTVILLVLLFLNLTAAFVGRFACFKYGDKRSAIAQFVFVFMTAWTCAYILDAGKSLQLFVGIIAASGWIAGFVISDVAVERRKRKQLSTQISTSQGDKDFQY